ncbi:MAG: CRISPR-associated endonuclease Cas2 [Desulfatibacillaceae bacterium]|nr:CRISPR-associated endonuclease Cas2 [Desulfatibacillaceae bacterium]
MGETEQLWVIVDRILDKSRRTRVRGILQFAGHQVRPGAFELVTTQTRMKSLLTDIGQLLSPEDDLRVYRICARCREATTVFGPGHLARPPVAIIV